MKKSTKTINARQLFLRVETGEAKALICAAKMQKSLQVPEESCCVYPETLIYERR